MALRQPLRFPTTAAAAGTSSMMKESNISSGLVRFRRRRDQNGILSSGFCDQGHLQYYKSSFGSSATAAAAEAAAADGKRMSVVSGKGVKSEKEKEKSLKKTKKKQLKLLKGLTKDLSTFSQMGFGLDSDGKLVDQIKGNMISEATQLLLQQLEKVKAEEKEQKRRMKEEKARSKAAARMQSGINCEMSSSSSSESSDSDCGEVVNMSSLKLATSVKTEEEAVKTEEETPSCPPPIIPTIPSDMEEEMKIMEEGIKIMSSSQSNVVQGAESDIGAMNSNCFVSPSCSNQKIEVCMGGKCKKSGAGAILEEFQRVVGIEGAVSGCKCMGKCRNGPVVKVVNEFDGGVVGPAPTTTNSLCIGVGLEDVKTIVANFIDEHQQNQQQLGFAS